MTATTQTTELPPPPPRTGGRHQIVLLLVAALIAALAAYNLPAWLGARYATEYAIRLAALPHGSIAILDLGTEINARGMLFDNQLQLVRGAILLDTRGSSSSSEVLIDGTRVSTQRGGRVLVRSHGSRRVEITSVEGQVQVRLSEDVQDGSRAPGVIDLGVGERVRLAPGKIVRSAPDLQTMKADLAWIVSMVTYRRTPLKEVVEEMNRLDNWTVKIADPFIANQLIDGVAVRAAQPMLDFLKLHGIDYSYSFDDGGGTGVQIFGLNSRPPK